MEVNESTDWNYIQTLLLSMYIIHKHNKLVAVVYRSRSKWSFKEIGEKIRGRGGVTRRMKVNEEKK